MNFKSTKNLLVLFTIFFQFALSGYFSNNLFAQEERSIDSNGKIEEIIQILKNIPGLEYREEYNEFIVESLKKNKAMQIKLNLLKLKDAENILVLGPRSKIERKEKIQNISRQESDLESIVDPDKLMGPDLWEYTDNCYYINGYKEDLKKFDINYQIPWKRKSIYLKNDSNFDLHFYPKGFFIHINKKANEIGHGAYKYVYYSIYVPKVGKIRLVANIVFKIQKFIDFLGEVKSVIKEARIMETANSAGIMNLISYDLISDSKLFSNFAIQQEIMQSTLKRKRPKKHLRNLKTREDLVKERSLKNLSDLKAAEDLLKGVKYFHDQDKFHRDIKPENVLHSKGDSPKTEDKTVLIDFGFVTGKDDFSKVSFAGSVWYNSVDIMPQAASSYYQKNGPIESRKIYPTLKSGKAHDIHSLGATLFKFYNNELHPITTINRIYYNYIKYVHKNNSDDKNVIITAEEFLSDLGEYKEEVEEAYKKYYTKNPPKDGTMDHLIMRMTHPKLEKRVTVDQALEEIKNIRRLMTIKVRRRNKSMIFTIRRSRPDMAQEQITNIRRIMAIKVRRRNKSMINPFGRPRPGSIHD